MEDDERKPFMDQNYGTGVGPRIRGISCLDTSLSEVKTPHVRTRYRNLELVEQVEVFDGNGVRNEDIRNGKRSETTKTLFFPPKIRLAR